MYDENGNAYQAEQLDNPFFDQNLRRRDFFPVFTDKVDLCVSEDDFDEKTESQSAGHNPEKDEDRVLYRRQLPHCELRRGIGIVMDKYFVPHTGW